VRTMLGSGGGVRSIKILGRLMVCVIYSDL